MLVDLGSARDFAFLDINSNPAYDALIKKGTFTGDIGWSGGSGTRITLKKATLTGDLYRAAGSSLKAKKGSALLGTDYPTADLSRFIADVDAAVAQFGSLTQDIDLGDIDQSGGLTLERTDKYTVIDMTTFKLSSGTLTLNGQADDIFYIRVGDIFELNSVDVVVNGTDSSRVFFIYDGDSDLIYDGGDFLGNIIAPNAAVQFSKIDSFSGSVISGGGFSFVGASTDTVFEHTVAIPEPTAMSLIGLFSGVLLYVRRIFRRKKSTVDT